VSAAPARSTSCFLVFASPVNDFSRGTSGEWSVISAGQGSFAFLHPNVDAADTLWPLSSASGVTFCRPSFAR
jgi:hypothetical protein